MDRFPRYAISNSRTAYCTILDKVASSLSLYPCVWLNGRVQPGWVEPLFLMFGWRLEGVESDPEGNIRLRSGSDSSAKIQRTSPTPVSSVWFRLGDGARSGRRPRPRRRRRGRPRRRAEGAGPGRPRREEEAEAGGGGRGRRRAGKAAGGRRPLWRQTEEKIRMRWIGG